MRQLCLLASFFVMIGLAACTPQADVETSASFQSEYFTVMKMGAGPHLILVPGLASSPDVWDQTVRDFQETHTLHVVHVSGFAGSAPRGNVGNDNILEDLATDLSAYSRTFEEPVHIAGHSLGGLVSLKTTTLPDANIHSLVVVDVLPFFSVLIDENATAETIAPMGAMMKATLMAQSDDVFESRQADTIKTLVKSAENQDLVLSWSLDSDREVMGQAMAEVMAMDLREKIAEINVPVTVIYARDPAIPNMTTIETFYEDLYAPLSNGTIHAVDDAFHFVMLDQPSAFSELLRRSIP